MKAKNELTLENLERNIKNFGKPFLLPMENCRYYSVIGDGFQFILVIHKDDNRNIEELIQKIHRSKSLAKW